jgi:hypothetical protein
MLIEGGADTVSRFIAARCLIGCMSTAPVMLARGPGIELPLERRMCPPMRSAYRIEDGPA